MGFNFNYNDENEYQLYGNMVHEEIELYGLTIKLFKSDRIGIDEIFGEHQSIKVNNDTIFEFNVKLEETDGFSAGGDFFSKFGLSSTATLDMFISSINMLIVYPDLYSSKGYSDIIGDLIKLPNGKFMEITHFEDELPGHNNMFVYADEKKIFKITTRAYTENRDELDGLDQEYEKIDLDMAFGIVDDVAVKQDVIAVKEIQEVPVDTDGDGINDSFATVQKKPTHIKNNPFGDL